jgi:uncharacterized membrane protein YjjP (DUF1212 family)
MAAANYPVTMVRGVMEQTSRAYGLDHQFLALPNYVQVGSPTGEGIYIANPDFDVRYDQSFPLAQLVARAPTGTISPEDGMAELDRIRNQRSRFPIWVTIVGYAVQSTGLALILQPTPWSLIGAASLGLMVGALTVLGRRVEAIGYLLPTICSFLVALIVFSFNNHWHVGVDSLRALAAPLATFLPGAAITLAVIELSTHHVVSGASRLVAGFMQIAQLAFGILIAAQVAGIADTNLVTTEINRLGVGTTARCAGLRSWRDAVLRPADVVSAMDAADAVNGIRRPMGRQRRAGKLRQRVWRRADTDHLRACHLAPTEHPADRIAGAAGLLAAGSRLARIHGRHPVARHPQHGSLHRDADLDDVDRRRRADRAAAVAGGDPDDVVTEPAGYA